MYFARESSGLVKVGASNNPPARVRALSAQAGREVVLLGVILAAGHAGERAVHRRLADARRPNSGLPTSEWFAPTPEVLRFVESHARQYIPTPSRQEGGITWLERFIACGSEPWITLEEAAPIVGCTPEDLCTMARVGAVPHIRIPTGRRAFRFKVTQLADWMRARTTSPAGAV